MIIVHDLIVPIGLLSDFKIQVLKWDSATVPMKEPIGMIWQTDITINVMRGVVMQTTEPVYTREDTERLVKIFDSTYANENIEQVAADTTQTKSEQRTKLLRLIKYFEDLFDVTLGGQYTDPVELELNTDYEFLIVNIIRSL